MIIKIYNSKGQCVGGGRGVWEEGAEEDIWT
jgi:hypothetical protein